MRNVVIVIAGFIAIVLCSLEIVGRDVEAAPRDSDESITCQEKCANLCRGLGGGTTCYPQCVAQMCS